VPADEEPGGQNSLPALPYGREELDVLLEAGKPLFDGEGEHCVDEPLVVVVVRNEFDLEVEAGGANEPLQSGVAGLLTAVLHARDLGLSDVRPLGKRALAQVRTSTSLP
jgi:hypothetical protein